MAYRVAVDSIGDGPRYDLRDTDDLIVRNNISVISTGNVFTTDDAAVTGFGLGRSVTVLGLVAGNGMGINVENPVPGNRTAATITIGTTGVIATQSNAISLTGNGNRILNYGQISSSGSTAIDLFSPSRDLVARVYNYGTITGVEGLNSVAGGEVSLFNYGKIYGGAYALFISSRTLFTNDLGKASVYNRGQIDGDIYLGDGNDKLLNRGLIVGDVDMAFGDDLLDNRGGTIEQTITMGDGADTFMPGASEETVDGGGNQYDKLDFSKSSGVKIALDGSIDGTGWAAGDTYTGFTDVTGSTLGADTLIGDAGINTLRGLGGNDTFSGQAGVDFLYGGAGNDTLDGGTDADQIYGGDGNDILIGGNDKSDFLSGEAGNDRLISGGGSDILVGGTGADTFVYTAKTDSGGTAQGTREQINDFSTAERDKIDLSAIDASTKVLGDQAFTFIGTTAFSNVAGQLRFAVSGSFITVQGDLNGDSIADIAFDLNGITSVAATDFVL